METTFVYKRRVSPCVSKTKRGVFFGFRIFDRCGDARNALLTYNTTDFDDRSNLNEKLDNRATKENEMDLYYMLTYPDGAFGKILPIFLAFLRFWNSCVRLPNNSRKKDILYFISKKNVRPSKKIFAKKN
jgi:hypothetical protein